MPAPPATNILSAANLTGIMISSISQSTSEESHLKSPCDAIALLAHSCFLAVDFRLIGLGEDHRLENPQIDAAPISLPSSWNASPSQNYAFKYSHPQSSMQYLLSISRLGTKAVINGLALGDEKVASLDVPVADYTSPSTLPFTLSSQQTSTSPPPSASPNRSSATPTNDNDHALQNVYISQGRIGDFSALVKIKLLQKLIPGMQKEGYQESAQAASERLHAAESQSPPAQTQREDIANREREPRRPPQDPLPPAAFPRPFGDPLAAGPRRGPDPDFAPPGFEDEHGILRPPGRGGLGGMGGVGGVGGYGDRDLYPAGLGPHDPLRIGGPMGGGYRGGSGGMHPNFDDPLFGGDGGGQGYDPSAPPGARFDPVGPGRAPRGAGGRFGGGPGRGGLGGGNPFGGFGGGDFI